MSEFEVVKTHQVIIEKFHPCIVIDPEVTQIECAKNW